MFKYNKRQTLFYSSLENFFLILKLLIIFPDSFQQAKQQYIKFNLKKFNSKINELSYFYTPLFNYKNKKKKNSILLIFKIIAICLHM